MTTETENVFYLVNLSDHRSRFRHQEVNLEWDRAGLYGSVLEVSEDVASLPFIKGALRRNRLKLITDRVEYQELLETLELSESNPETSMNNLLEYMSEGSSEKTSRFTNSNLSDYAESTRDYTPEQIFKTEAKPKTVSRDGVSIVDSPIMDATAVLQERETVNE